MLREADAGVVVDRLRGGEEDDATGSSFLNLAKEFLADTLALDGFADTEVAAVSDVSEISEAAGGPGEGVAVPRGNEEIGVVEHLLDCVPIGDGPPFSESGGVEQFDVLVGSETAVCAVLHPTYYRA